MLSRKGIKQKLSSEQLVKNYELINSYVQNSQKAALELPNDDVWLSEVNVVELIAKVSEQIIVSFCKDI